jgi:transketolase
MTASPSINAHALRVLAMDAVEQAQSGHPGMPMGMADIAQVLWQQHLKHNPKNPNWFNRDRFVLSNGHGCMLLYALLHLSGYDLSLDDLQKFRQLHSKTPGHPEFGLTPGVEATTGPLGQGLANAVGMAIAEAHLAATFNQPNHPIIDHQTYAFCGDGCLMEGISHEACSLAGTLKLNKLTVLWDDNGISIDGPIESWCRDDTCKRFEAYGWHVQTVDGHNPKAIAKAIAAAHKQHDKPSFIACKTQIGFGANTKAGQASSHGAPLGTEEIKAAREAYGWTHPPFEIPQTIYQAWDATQSGQKAEADWNQQLQNYTQAHPQLAKQLKQQIQGDLGINWPTVCNTILQEARATNKPTATRKASLWCLNQLANQLPALFGGSADLTGSNLTQWDGAPTFNDTRKGRYVHYGVREFGQSAVANGIALHGGLIPYTGTFLTFIDYSKNALRLAALMGIRSIYVLSHDSIGLGEDGPTHQPIEHLANLRAMPHVHVWRPCDTYETAISWQQALTYQGPSCLALSRQNLPAQSHDQIIGEPEKGGYVLTSTSQPAALTFVATGSEVGLAQEAARQLKSQGIHASVVSMPCIDVFCAQDSTYQERVLPPNLPRIFVEAGHPQSWFALKRDKDAVIGLSDFGHSAPAQDIFTEMNLTTKQLIAVAQTQCKQTEQQEH